MGRLSSSLIEAVHRAAWRSFWRKRTLYMFLLQHGISDAFIAARGELTKKQVLDEVFTALVKTSKGQAHIVAMGQDLSDRVDFPDLLGFEESEQMVQEARAAVASLRKLMVVVDKAEQLKLARNAAAQFAASRDEAIRRTALDLQALSGSLMTLAKDIGTQSAGHAFQAWFYDFMDHSEVSSRRPYKAEGREIDGSITIGDTTYIIELKFTSRQVGPVAVDSLHKKVLSKADNTMGILLSMSGFTAVATKEASGPRTPLLLLDHSHIVPCLDGRITFVELIRRVRRHASQTGDSYLSAEMFGL